MKSWDLGILVTASGRNTQKGQRRLPMPRGEGEGPAVSPKSDQARGMDDLGSGRPGRVREMEARAVATELLAGVGTRVAHSRAVAHQASVVVPVLDAPWSSALLDAAWLHDVGYSPSVAVTGFHPLDGARWLSAHGWPAKVCRLVAWHTRSGTEATLRHLTAELTTEFPPPPDVAQAALAWADLTSSPVGECCLATERVADILRRYPPESVVHRATSANLPDLLMDVLLIETKIDAARVVLR